MEPCTEFLLIICSNYIRILRMINVSRIQPLNTRVLSVASALTELESIIAQNVTIAFKLDCWRSSKKKLCISYLNCKAC